MKDVTVAPGVAEFVERFASAVDFQKQVSIAADTPLESLPEWDSLAALGVIIMCDADYGVAVTGDDLKKAKSVGDIYSTLQIKKAA